MFIFLPFPLHCHVPPAFFTVFFVWRFHLKRDTCDLLSFRQFLVMPIGSEATINNCFILSLILQQCHSISSISWHWKMHWTSFNSLQPNHTSTIEKKKMKKITVNPAIAHRTAHGPEMSKGEAVVANSSWNSFRGCKNVRSNTNIHLHFFPQAMLNK